VATDQQFADYVCEQIRSTSPISTRKMFGEYALYHGEKVVALLCDNSIFLKPLPEVLSLVKAPTFGAPYPGAKPHLVGDEFLDDADLLTALVEATAAALPAPKPKKSKAKVTAKTKAKRPPR
jgi:TfoX/Sxy family transcriptional regulator of competence genes